MFDMLKQMKEMKSKIKDFKDSVEQATFFGQDSNNIIKVKISGKGILLDIDISKDYRDQEYIEKIILEAYNNAKVEADKFYDAEIIKITGGMALPFDMKSFL
tara:strand:- start:11307 stop:11612 length:306 start_codon:yes stop_codon:yes gene_type:complete